MMADTRMRVVLFLLQVQAALCGSSSLNSNYGTSVSAKGSMSHAMLLKQQQRQREQQLQLLRKEAHGGDDDSDIEKLGKQSASIDSLADLDASLHVDDGKKLADDSNDSDHESSDLGVDLPDQKDSSTKASIDPDDDISGANRKDIDGADDPAQQSMILAGLEQGAKDAQDGALLKSLKQDMAADNAEGQTSQKEESLDDVASTLGKEDAQWDSINADLANLHQQIYGSSPKAKKDNPSLNSSVLQVAAAQKASDWLDKQLGEMGTPNQTEAHSWLDEEYAKIQKKQAKYVLGNPL